MQSISDKFLRNMELIHNAHNQPHDKVKAYKAALLKMTQRYGTFMAQRDPATLLNVIHTTSRNPHTQNDAAIQEIVLPKLNFSQQLASHIEQATRGFADHFLQSRLPEMQWLSFSNDEKLDRFASHAVTYINLLDPENILNKNQVNPNLVLEKRTYFDQDRWYERGRHYPVIDKTELIKSNRYNPLLSEQEGAILLVHESFHRFTDGAGLYHMQTGQHPSCFTPADLALLKTMNANELYHHVDSSYELDPRERMARYIAEIFNLHTTHESPDMRYITPRSPVALGALIQESRGISWNGRQKPAQFVNIS